MNYHPLDPALIALARDTGIDARYLTLVELREAATLLQRSMAPEPAPPALLALLAAVGTLGV